MLKNGFFGGLGFGLAISTVHIVIGTVLILALGMPPLTAFAFNALLIEIACGLIAGIVLSPLTRLPQGKRIHIGVLAALWIGMEWWVAVDPTKVQQWIGPTVGSLVVFAIGSAIWKRWPKVLAGLAVVFPIVVLLIPDIKHRAEGGYNLKPPADRPKAAEGSPDVLFIVMDTVRAASVSAYGYERKTTPNFDKLASEGLFVADATSAATWSLPAHSSLFTGAFPSVTGANEESRFLYDGIPTIAETMAGMGYETRAFSANPYISESFGLTRGFDWTDQAWITGAGGRGFTFIYRLIDSLGFSAEDKGGGQVVNNIQNWMAERPKDAPPAFVFVNFLEAHFPFHQLPEDELHLYTHEDISELREDGQIAFGVQFGRQLTDAEYTRIRQPITDMYDGGVHYTDFLVGEVIEEWRKRGLLDHTVVVVLGDHGETTGEHGAFGHVTPMYDEILRVPLMFRYPPKIAAGSRIDMPVSSVATFATIMDLLGQPKPPRSQLSSLLPGIDGAIVGQPVISERAEEHMLSARFEPGTANGHGPLLSPFGRYRTFRSGNYKLGKYSDGSVYLFDVKADPGEMTDLATSQSGEKDRLLNELSVVEDSYALIGLTAELPKGPANVELSDAAQEQLRALGYVE